MAEKILQHKHCPICGKAILIEEEYCGDKCKNDFESMVRKRKYLMYLMYGAIILFFIIILLGAWK